MHSAYPVLSSNPANIWFSLNTIKIYPSRPIESKNHLIYGPGNPFKALKHKLVSSQKTAVYADW